MGALAIVAASVLGALSSPGQSAQTLVYSVTAPVCTVESSIPATSVVSLQSAGAQTLGQLTYTCNAFGGLTRQITSQHGGALTRGADIIPYELSEASEAGLALAPTRLTVPVSTSIPGSQILTVGQQSIIAVRLTPLTNGLLAGEYTDTVTIEITSN